jgi:DNA-binding XRE family transcriptional regulator
VEDINALRAQIVEAPDLLKADHERLKRLKNEVTEKKSTMMAQISAKKQTLITLEQELAAQEKRLRLLTDVTEKNERLS